MSDLRDDRPRIAIWLEAFRPKTLFAGVSPVLIGTAFAIDAGSFHLPSAICALCAALAIQIGTNLHNDLADFATGADTEDRVGPRRVSQLGLIDRRTMRRAIVIAFAVAGLLGAWAVARAGWPMLVVLAASVAAALGYTGGPRPLGYLGLGDLFVLIFFGPVAVGGTYYLQSLSSSGEVLLAGLATGALSTAILVVNNLRDRHTDHRAGKLTLAVRFGGGFARAEYVLLLAMAAAIPLLPVLAGRRSFFAAAPLLTLIPAVPAVRSVAGNVDGAALNHVLAATGQLVVIHALLFAAGLLLSQ